jgi:lipopolysaccharide exporter
MSTFGQNVLTIGAGNVIAQVISLAAIPIISRLYTPTEYGVFATYIAIATTLFPLATLRYSAAILLPESEEDVTNLAFMAFCASIIIALLALILVSGIIFLDLLPESWRQMHIPGILWVIPLGLLIQGIGEISTGLVLRAKRFTVSSMARILESIVDRGLVLSTGYFISATASLLVAGRTIGPLIGNLFLLRAAISSSNQSRRRVIMWRSMIKLAKRYKNFALIATWASLFDSASRQAPVLLLSMFFPPSVAGHYMLAMQVVNLPMMVVGDAIANVFLQRSAEHRNDTAWLASTALRLIRYLILLAVPFVLVMSFLGKDIFAVLFGAQWQEAGLYLQILAVSFLLMFLHRPFSVLFDVMEKQRTRLIFDSILLSGRILAIFVAGHELHDPYVALTGIVVVTLVVYGAGLVYLFGLVRVRSRDLAEVVQTNACLFFPLALSLPILVYLDLGKMTTILLTCAMLAIQAAVIIKKQPDIWYNLVRAAGLRANPT